MLDDLGEFSLAFNGWSTDYDVVRLSALDGVRSRSGSSPRSGNIPYGAGNGAVLGPLYLSERAITAVVHIKGDSDVIEEQMSAMEAAFALRSDELPLTWTIRDVTRQIACRVYNVDPPVDESYARGVARVVIQWVASSPLMYAAGVAANLTSPGLHTVQTSAGTVTGGLGFSHGFSHGFGTATTGVMSLYNSGSTPAPWTATLKGPLSGPRIDLVGTTGVLAMNGFTLLDGDTLEFDSQNRTVLLNGTANYYSSLSSSEWFNIPVGSAQVQLTTTSGGSHSDALVLRWRDVWL